MGRKAMLAWFRVANAVMMAGVRLFDLGERLFANQPCGCTRLHTLGEHVAEDRRLGGERLRGRL